MKPYGERHKRRPRGISPLCWWAFIQRREQQARRGNATEPFRYWWEPNDVADRRKQRRYAREQGKRESRQGDQ
jgi:hypothetical protein